MDDTIEQMLSQLDDYMYCSQAVHTIWGTLMATAGIWQVFSQIGMCDCGSLGLIKKGLTVIDIKLGRLGYSAKTTVEFI